MEDLGSLLTRGRVTRAHGRRDQLVDQRCLELLRRLRHLVQGQGVIHPVIHTDIHTDQEGIICLSRQPREPRRDCRPVGTEPSPAWCSMPMEYMLVLGSMGLRCALPIPPTGLEQAGLAPRREH